MKLDVSYWEKLHWTKRPIVGFLIALLLAAGCSGGGQSPATGDRAHAGASPLTVAVTVEPLRWLVSRLGGEAVHPVTVVPPGQNHETWEPAPGHMETLRQATVYFETGMPFEEPLIQRLRGLNPSLEAVCLLDAVTERMPPPEAEPPVASGEAESTQAGAAADAVEQAGETPAAAEDHHGEHHHAHAHGDPHFWTDPRAMMAAAERVAEVLAARLPEHAADIRAALEGVREDLASLEGEIARLMAPFRGRRYYVFHPETGWFARRYELVERAVEQHGKAPGARTLDDLVREIREAGVTTVFTQSGYPAVEVNTLARTLNLRVQEVNLARPDYPEALRELARSLAAGFGSEVP